MQQIKNPRKAKLLAYIKAHELINTGDFTIRQAIEKVGISQTTYYAYLAQFGDNIKGMKITLPVKEPKTVPAVEAKPQRIEKTGTDLERILQENAALAEQLKLRAELAKMMH